MGWVVIPQPIGVVMSDEQQKVVDQENPDIVILGKQYLRFLNYNL